MLTKVLPVKHKLITEKNEWRAELKVFQKLKLWLNAIMTQASGVKWFTEAFRTVTIFFILYLYNV